jgi:hypothetical protein
MDPKLYIGSWVTLDGYTTRQELLPDGRYTEKSDRVSQGHYRIEDDQIEYVDDAGVISKGRFINGTLHYNGQYLYIDIPFY